MLARFRPALLHAQALGVEPMQATRVETKMLAIAGLQHGLARQHGADQMLAAAQPEQMLAAQRLDQLDLTLEGLAGVQHHVLGPHAQS